MNKTEEFNTRGCIFLKVQEEQGKQLDRLLAFTRLFEIVLGD
jgi:hypothetical protein